MSLKVSSGGKKKGQRHQNSHAFAVSKFSFTQQRIAALPVHGLCQRCLEIIQWKKRMNKYKPLTAPKKCVTCDKKEVREAYHALCTHCARVKNVCAKCQLSSNILPSDSKTPQEKQLEMQEEERILGGMSERQRRSYLRKMQRGDIEEAKVLANKIDDGGWSDNEEDDECQEPLENALDSLDEEEEQ